MIARFGERMNDMLRNGDHVFRSAHVVFVDEVIVSPDEIRITGAGRA